MAVILATIRAAERIIDAYFAFNLPPMIKQLGKLVLLQDLTILGLCRQHFMRRCILPLLLGLAFAPFAAADELVLDESFTEMQTVGDFDVSTFMTPVDLSEQALLTDHGEINAGQLYSYFKSRGLTSVHELNLCLDVNSGIRADYALNDIELRIEHENASTNEIYRLGDDHILKLPSYEASDMKPEAGITIKLGYDFMKQYDENSTQKLKFMVDGQEVNSLPMQIAYLVPPNYFSYNRFAFFTAFAVFWIFVFLVLFRTTLPKDRNVASAA